MLQFRPSPLLQQKWDYTRSMIEITTLVLFIWGHTLLYSCLTPCSVLRVHSWWVQVAIWDTEDRIHRKDKYPTCCILFGPEIATLELEPRSERKFLFPYHMVTLPVHSTQIQILASFCRQTASYPESLILMDLSLHSIKEKQFTIKF